MKARQDFSKVLIPCVTDVQEEFINRALRQLQVGHISRVFNRAQPSDAVKKIIHDFCQTHLDSDFVYDLERYSVAADDHRKEYDSPFTEACNLKPWVTEFLAPTIQKPLNQLYKQLWKMATQIIHDKEGNLCPWLFEFLGKENLIKAVHVYSLPVVREQLIVGVMQCIAGELSNIQEQNNSNENNFRMIAMNIVTQQNFLKIACHAEQVNLIQEIDRRRRREGYTPLVNKALAVVTASKKIMEKFTEQPCYDAGSIAKGLIAARKVVVNDRDRAAANELNKIAKKEAVGKPSTVKKFFAVLAALASVAIFSLSLLGIPATGGASAIGMKVSAGLLAFSSATLFYQSRQQGFSKSLTQLKDAMPLNGKDHEEPLLEMKALS